MPRPVWNGTISFGLVSIPIKLYHAVNRKSVSFNQLDDRTMSRIRLKKVSAESGEEVPDDHIVKGYEISKGRYVVVDPDELEPLIPAASRAIELDEFVDLGEIDPLFFDAAYHVAPDDKAAKPYVLLARAMEDAGKVAIGRFVMRNKQFVSALRAVDGRLLLATLVYADELVRPESIDELADLDQVEVTDKELAMASQLVESLSDDLDLGQYRDAYREQVLELIERKAAGEVFEAPEPMAPVTQVVDLMAALEASVKAAKASRQRHPTSRTGDGEGAVDDEATDAGADEQEVVAASAKPTRSRARKSA